MGTSLNSRRRKRGLPILFTLSLLMVLAASAMFVYELVAFSQREERLPVGITVAGIDVSGLSERDAVALWESAYAKPIQMFYRDFNGNHPIRLHPDQLGWRISSDPMLADALASGEADGGFWRRFLDYMLGVEQTLPRDIPLLADYQENALSTFLNDVAARYDSGAGSPGYDLQTLTVFPGESGYALDIEAAMAAIDLALRTAHSRSIDLPIDSMMNNQPTLLSLQNLIIDYLDSQGFIYDGQTTVASIFVLDLLTGEEINILGDVAYSAASTVKVPIMLDFYRLLARAPSQDEAWLLANSLLCSNNSSSNLIMEIIGGGDILFNLIYDCAEFGSGLMTSFPEGQIAQQECRQMLELISANDIERLLQGGIPRQTRIAHKNGWIFDTVGDAGVVYSPNGRDYVISVYLWESAEFQDYEKLWPLVEEISRAAWNYFNPENALLVPRANLPATAQECAGNYLPPAPELVNLNDINSWKSN